MLHSFAITFGFFSTLLVDAFADEEAVFYPLHHNHRELDQVKQPPEQQHSNGRLIFHKITSLSF
ncbi:hypothetical protein SD436_04345 [Streptococcus sp. 2A/TPW/M5]